MSGCFSVDSDSAGGGLTRRKGLQRIISIEEDPLPQLLDRSERQLTKWSEEDEDVLLDMQMNGIQATPPLEQTPSSLREQPVGKETRSNVRNKITLLLICIVLLCFVLEKVDHDRVDEQIPFVIYRAIAR